MENKKLVANRYELETIIGKGGMGIVYKGLDLNTNQPIAVKQLKNEISTPDVIERFRREAKALRDLNHPNIVKIIDEVNDNGVHYLIIEYIDGGDLSNLIPLDGLPINKILNIAIDLCDAITRAHRLNIIHRDLKPANVLIATDGTPRLTDFGVAHIAEYERVTDSDYLIGTLDYLAPEVLYGNPTSLQADIWAFGIILYEMLIGSRPFTAPSHGGVIHAILSSPLPDIEILRPGVPVKFVDLIYWMLEKEPEARVSTMRRVGLILEEVLHGDDWAFISGTNPDKTLFKSIKPIVEKHNLPLQMTRFIGRSAELARLASLLDNPNVRLITLLGPGGIGKTRVALESAQQHIPLFQDGVYQIDCSTLSDVGHLAIELAEITGYRFQDDQSNLLDEIILFLENKNLLLILDSFEELLSGQFIVANLLKQTNKLNIMITTRKPMQRSDEHIIYLTGLHIQDIETLEEANKEDVIQLFTYGAKRLQPIFNVDENNYKSIYKICTLVGGMPLAVLLAASWIDMLSPDEILNELMRQGINILTHDLEDFPERHRSIGKLIDQTWDSLTPLEKQVFQRLSIFSGNFSREAADAVASANLLALRNLKNKSLLHRDPNTGLYTIHNLLHQFARKQLEASDEYLVMREQHCQFNLEYLHHVEGDLLARYQVSALQDIDVNIENIRQAWLWAVSNNKATLIEEAVNTLYWYCFYKGYSDLGKQLIGDAIEHFSQQDLHTYDTTLLRLRTRFYGKQALTSNEADTILQAIQNLADIPEKSFSLIMVGLVYKHAGQIAKAFQQFTEGLAIATHINHEFYVAMAHSELSMWYLDRGDTRKGFNHIKLSIDFQKQSGDQNGLANSLKRQGYLHWIDGNYHAAMLSTQDAMAIYSELNNHHGIVLTGAALGALQILQGQIENARAITDNSLAIARDYNYKQAFAWLIINKGHIALVDEDFKEASKLLEEGYELGQEHALSIEASWGLSVLACIEDDLDNARNHNLQGLKYSLQTKSVAYMALHLPITAAILMSEQNIQEAVKLASAASHQAEYPRALFKIIPFFESFFAKIHAMDNNVSDAWKSGASADIEALVKAYVE